MEDKYRACGWAFTIYGGILLSVVTYLYKGAYMESVAIMSFSFLVSMLFFIVSLLTVLCGIYMLKGNPKVHKIALPISVLALINVPLGTVVGGLYLWLRYKNA